MIKIITALLLIGVNAVCFFVNAHLKNTPYHDLPPFSKTLLRSKNHEAEIVRTTFVNEIEFIQWLYDIEHFSPYTIESFSITKNSKNLTAEINLLKTTFWTLLIQK